MKPDKAFARYLWGVSEDAGDSPLDLAEDAFRAGWQAALNEPVKGTLSGDFTHNGDSRPGHLMLIFRGKTSKGREIRAAMTEDAVLVMLASLSRTAIGLDNPRVMAAAIIHPQTSGEQP